MLEDKIKQMSFKGILLIITGLSFAAKTFALFILWNYVAQPLLDVQRMSLKQALVAMMCWAVLSFTLSIKNNE